MPQTFAACPTEMVEAPIEVVWRLLTNPAGWGEFYDVGILSVEPSGLAAVGQRIVAASGPAWPRLRVRFEFTLIDPAQHRLEFDVALPLGLSVAEQLDCIPLAADRCRVNYHCNFTIPGGWRGLAIRTLLGRELAAGPIDSIRRLKRAAEATYRRGSPET